MRGERRKLEEGSCAGGQEEEAVDISKLTMVDVAAYKPRAIPSPLIVLGRMERLQLFQDRRDIMNPLMTAGLAMTNRFMAMIDGRVETKGYLCVPGTPMGQLCGMVGTGAMSDS